MVAEFDSSQFLDLSLAAWLMDSTLGSTASVSIPLLTARYVDGQQQRPTTSEQNAYANREWGITATWSEHWDAIWSDQEMTGKLIDILRKRIVAQNQLNVLLNQEIPIAVLLAHMDLSGVAFEDSTLQQHSHALRTSMSQLEREAQRVAGHDFLISSPQQVSHLLFERLGLPFPNSYHEAQTRKSLKTAHRSTGDNILQELVDCHPVITCIQKYRAVAKILNTYVEALHPMSGGTIKTEQRRIHCIWNQKATVTGRLSSSHPNVQNIPKMTELKDLTSKAAQINCRDAFVATVHRLDVAHTSRLTLVAADYRQMEVRLLGALCRPGRLRDLFLKKHDGCIPAGATERQDDDVYQEMAAVFSGSAAHEVSPELRSRVKVACLSIMYGSGVKLLSSQMHCTVEEAVKFRTSFLQSFPEIVEFSDEVVRRARSYGFVATISGRRRYLPEINSTANDRRAEAERQAINTTIQGTAADVMKLAMLRVSDAIKDHTPAWQYPAPRIVLSVHDELVCECQRPQVPDVIDILQKAMAGGLYKLSVPLPVQIQVGDTWGSMKEYVSEEDWKCSEDSKCPMIE
eukprot:Lankesteria_metandrocarpae@DN5288_c0_g1_i1.p1